MNILTQDTWRLEHSSKIDILDEPAHTHLIHKFLLDEETSVEKDGDNYILSGNEEALLVVPKKIVTRLLLFFIWTIKKLSN